MSGRHNTPHLLLATNTKFQFFVSKHCFYKRASQVTKCALCSYEVWEVTTQMPNPFTRAPYLSVSAKNTAAETGAHVWHTNHSRSPRGPQPQTE